MLRENKKMFDGTLIVYPHKKVHIDIDPSAKPVHPRPCPVPQIHVKAFKTELQHLVRIGVCVCVTQPPGEGGHWPLLHNNAGWHWFPSP